MKNKNLINKKIMSTGLTASLLLTSLGAAPCFAHDPCSAKANTKETSTLRYGLKKPYTTSKAPTKQIKAVLAAKACDESPNTTNELTEEKFGITNDSQSQQSHNNSSEKTKLSLSEAHFIDIDEIKNTNNKTHLTPDSKKLELENDEPIANDINKINSQAQITETNDKQNIKNKSASKTETAKTVAKTVAAAAIVGAATYFGYKYRAPIVEGLDKASSYISNKVNLVINNYKNSKKLKTPVNPLQIKYHNSSIINDICPITQTKLWKCPSEKQPFFSQFKNEVVSKTNIAFNCFKSLLTKIKGKGIENSNSFIKSNCTAIVPVEKSIFSKAKSACTAIVPVEKSIFSNKFTSEAQNIIDESYINRSPVIQPLKNNTGIYLKDILKKALNKSVTARNMSKKALNTVVNFVTAGFKPIDITINTARPDNSMYK